MLDMSTNKKIFVVSLHRSLTRSTDALLSMLGYKTMHLPKFYNGQNLMQRIRGKEDNPQEIIEALQPVLEDYDSVSDVPIPTLYAELAEMWPESLFILVNRDPEAWAWSVKNLMKERKLSRFNRIQYEHYFCRKIKRINDISLLSLMGMHVKHASDVKRHFYSVRKEPNRICVVDSGDEYIGEKICTFLGHSPRALPYISDNANDASFPSTWEWVNTCPDKADARYFYALHLLKNGDDERAKEELQMATDADDNFPKPPAMLSNTYHKEGLLNMSGILAEQSIKRGFMHPRLSFRASRYYLRNKSYKNAIYYGLQGLYWKASPK